MSRPNDTVPDPLPPPDSDPARTQVEPQRDGDRTDPGPPPENQESVADVLEGLGGRAPVYRKRVADSAGLSGAHYDATTVPVKGHDAGEIPAPVIVNVTEPMPAPTPVAAFPSARDEVTQPPTRLPLETAARDETTLPRARARKQQALFLACAAGIVILVALVAMAFVVPSRPQIPSATSSPAVAAPPPSISIPTPIASPVVAPTQVPAHPQPQPPEPPSASPTSSTRPHLIPTPPRTGSTRVPAPPRSSGSVTPSSPTSPPAAASTTPRSDLSQTQ